MKQQKVKVDDDVIINGLCKQDFIKPEKDKILQLLAECIDEDIAQILLSEYISDDNLLSVLLQDKEVECVLSMDMISYEDGSFTPQMKVSRIIIK